MHSAPDQRVSFHVVVANVSDLQLIMIQEGAPVPVGEAAHAAERVPAPVREPTISEQIEAAREEKKRHRAEAKAKAKVENKLAKKRRKILDSMKNLSREDVVQGLNELDNPMPKPKAKPKAKAKAKAEAAP